MSKLFVSISATGAIILVVACGYTKSPSPEAVSKARSVGRKLFLKNCAHCHGVDAHGDEGPDLHTIDWSPEQIARRIRNGKKGQMTAFAQKLTADEIASLVGYVRSLK